MKRSMWDDEATDLFTQLVQSRKKTLGREHIDTLSTMELLSSAFYELKR
jgi:hypothetical protein